MRYNSHTMKLILLSIQFSIFNIITELCKNHRNLRIFFTSPRKKLQYPLAVDPQSLLSFWQPLIYLALLWIFLLWTFHVNGTLPLWLVFLTLYNVFYVRLCFGKYQYFIPLCCSIMLHCVNVPYCDYPFINWYAFVLLTFFAVMNNAAMNILVQVFAGTYIFISLVYIPRSEISGSYCNTMFNILKTAKLFSKVATQFLIPPTIYEGSIFSTVLLTLVIICLFYVYSGV